MNYSNYRDFYQKALIPIGIKDQFALDERNKNLLSNPEHFTHWLIALEAECSETPKEYYYWKVLIYPSDSEGSYNWRNPFYTSPLMESLNQAIELARTFEFYSMKDELHTVNFQEKIS